MEMRILKALTMTVMLMLIFIMPVGFAAAPDDAGTIASFHIEAEDPIEAMRMVADKSGLNIGLEIHVPLPTEKRVYLDFPGGTAHALLDKLRSLYPTATITFDKNSVLIVDSVIAAAIGSVDSEPMDSQTVTRQMVWRHVVYGENTKRELKEHGCQQGTIIPQGAFRNDSVFTLLDLGSRTVREYLSVGATLSGQNFWAITEGKWDGKCTIGFMLWK
jgi:hypothetical protein